MIKKIFVASLALFLYSSTVQIKAQTSLADSLKKDSILKNSLKVFMDIGNCYACGFSYIRKEIDYVNYVRDPRESQVQVIIVGSSTGSGGTEFTFMFIGKNEFNGMNDTIKSATSVNNSEDENRIEIVRILKLGLTRYIMKTPGNKLIEIKSNLPESANENVQDKWKSWVFDVNLSGYGNGEKSYSSLQLYSSYSGRKITPEWKIRFSANSNYRESKYVIDDTTTYRMYIRSYYFNYNTVKSLSKHWSTGVFYNGYNSSYSNMDLGHTVSAGLEYDVFPYDKSASKLITFRYKIGCEINKYIDTTIYNKMNETLLQHSIGMGMNYITKWGSTTTSLSYSNYLHDFTMNNLYISTSLTARLFKGFSLSGYLYFSMIHDQVALTKGTASLEEILLQQQQLATQFSYYFNIGVTYTFGSIYNNVVNPRFDY
ncbi:MAG: hypothetical protein V2A54_02870 [Bacteroidota bacterium]